MTHPHVPEVVEGLEFQLVVLVVGEDEREHWILHEVIERPPRKFVQFHQVLKVGDLTLVPAVYIIMCVYVLCMCVHMWQSQVENEHYSTVSGLIQIVISLECFIEITPDFLCPFMND